MKRYTTPTLAVRIEGNGLAGCDVYVTLKQGSKKLTFTGEDIVSLELDDDGMTVYIVLTQEQTAAFRPNLPVLMQANVVDPTGRRAATEMKNVGIWNNLLDEVIEFEGTSPEPSEGGSGGGGSVVVETRYGIDVIEVDGERRMVFVDRGEDGE